MTWASILGTLCTEQCVGLRDVWALSAGNLMDGRRCDVQMYLDLNSNRTQMGFEPACRDNNLGRYFLQYSTVLYRTRRGPCCNSSCSSMQSACVYTSGFCPGGLARTRVSKGGLPMQKKSLLQWIHTSVPGLRPCHPRSVLTLATQTVAKCNSASRWFSI